MADYSEALFDSIQALIDKTVDNLDYTKTEECIIVNSTKAEQGQYKVKTNKGTELTVFSNNTDYKNGDRVQINIPNGDYSGTKVILDKIKQADSELLTEEKIASQYFDITGNICNNIGNQGLTANSTEKEISVQDLSNLQLLGYNHICIKARFKSLLKSFNTVKGEYGLKLTITAQNDEQLQNYFYVFSNANMVGDTYNFVAPFLQEYLFDVSEISGMITGIKVDFYQIPGSFKNKYNEEIPTQDNLGTSVKNLQVSDLYISFGYPVTEASPESVILYSDKYFYNTNEPSNIYLRWLHMEEDKMEQIESIPSGAIVRWYKYSLGQPAADQYSGNSWVAVNYDSEDYYPHTIYYSTEGDYYYYLNEENYPIAIDEENYKSTQYILQGAENKNYEQIKAFVFYKGNVYKSNVIQIYNNNYKPISQEEKIDIASNAYGVNFRIIDPVGDLGKYYFYGSDNRVLDNNNSTLVRKLQVMLNNSALPEDIKYIKWFCDTSNSMLSQVKYTNLEPLDSGEDQVKGDCDIFTYQVKPYYYVNQAVQTYVDCEFGIGDKIYRGRFTPDFGQSSNGTTRSLLLELCKKLKITDDEDGQETQELSYLHADSFNINDCDTYDYYIHPYILDATGQQIDIDSSQIRMELNKTEYTGGKPDTILYEKDDEAEEEKPPYTIANQNLLSPFKDYYIAQEWDEQQQTVVDRYDLTSITTSNYKQADTVNFDPYKHYSVLTLDQWIPDGYYFDSVKQAYVPTMVEKVDEDETPKKVKTINSYLNSNFYSLEITDYSEEEDFEYRPGLFYHYDEITKEYTLDFNVEPQYPVEEYLSISADNLVLTKEDFSSNEYYYLNNELFIVATEFNPEEVYYHLEKIDDYKEKLCEVVCGSGVISNYYEIDNSTTNTKYIPITIASGEESRWIGNAYQIDEVPISATDYNKDSETASSIYVKDKNNNYTFYNGKETFDGQLVYLTIKRITIGYVGTGENEFSLWPLVLENNQHIVYQDDIISKTFSKQDEGKYIFAQVSNLNKQFFSIVGDPPYYFLQPLFETIANNDIEKNDPDDKKNSYNNNTIDFDKNTSMATCYWTIYDEQLQQDVELSASISIPISSQDISVNGCFKLEYDSSGTEKPNTNIPFFTDYVTDNELVWEITNFEASNPEYLYLPKISKNGVSNNYYISSLFDIYIQTKTIPSISLYEIVKINDSSVDDSIREEKTLLYAAPILITQNRYGNDIINGWNGSTIVNEDKNYILSQMIGAGVKNKDNSFSGVIMGRVADQGYNSQTGLYGFHEGEQSYAFKEDGTAFIGKSGQGRISFDGNESVIQSGNYVEINNIPKAGMKIDLDDGSIKAGALNIQDLFVITPDGKIQLSEDTQIVGKDNAEFSIAMPRGVKASDGTLTASFTSSGLVYSNSADNIESTLDNKGLVVSEVISTTGEVNEMLIADTNGVQARNLEATTYLIIGGRSRFENYKTDRTGCFWIG